MKKRLLFKLGLVALLGAGLLYGWLWWTTPRTGICRYTADLIRPGMSKEEVIKIIGMPPGRYGVSENAFIRFRNPKANSFSTRWFTGWEIWYSPQASIEVEFSEDQVLSSGYFVDEKLADKLRRWLRLD